MIVVCRRRRLPPVGSVHRRLLCGQLHGLRKADASGTHGERHAICLCLPADGTSRPILNGDFGTSPFYGQHAGGTSPPVRMSTVDH
jgi:hypothetical protein